jgi:hypothetical protein
VRWGTKLIVFDLGNKLVPWEKWIPCLKTEPATRRIPIICYGSHVFVDTLKKARKLGADEVLARSRFVTVFPELAQKYILRADNQLMKEVCKNNLHLDAVKGLELLNNGDYYGAHEYLEQAWLIDLSRGRVLYQGVLQIAVAYFHIKRGNYRGSIKMIQRAQHWLGLLPDICRGIDVSQLRQDAYVVYDEIIMLGPEGLVEFDSEKIKPVMWGLN